MKKILFAICVALLTMFSSLSVSAQEPVTPMTVININTKDGGVTRYFLSSKPVVSVVDDKLVINADEIEELELSRAEVSHIDFSEDWTGSVSADQLHVNDFVFSFIDNNNVMMASPSLSHAEVFDIVGHKMATVFAADGNLTISLVDFPAGVYVIAPDCHAAVKIVKK